ncbi:MAG: hypothetical protein RLZZ267_1457 [Bacillota bacterium]
MTRMIIVKGGLGRVTKLQILHTNDIHSRFERMPAIATLIQQLRERHQGPSLVIDLGDHIDRSHVITEGTDGMANIAVMNATGYDYFVPGNNEGLALSHPTMTKLFGDKAKFRTLGTNIFELTTGKRPTWCSPYELISQDGIKIALFGLTASLMRYYRLLGWDVVDPIAMMQVAMEDVRGHVDAVVVMSHLGIDIDRKLATEVAGIDCIIGGHTHHLFEQAEWVGQTAICCAGKFGMYVGEVTLAFSEGQRCQIHARVIATKDIPADEGIAEIIAQHDEIAALKLNHPIATLHQAIPHHYAEDSVLGNLLAQVVRTRTNADFSLINNGQFLDSLEQGDLTRRMMLERCPSPVQICRMRLSGEQIRYTLEQSLLLEYQQYRFQGFGFRGDVLGGMSVDGLRIEYDSDAPDMHKIQRIWVRDEILQDHQEYVVGTLDLFTFGVGYLKLREGSDMEFFLPSIIRDELTLALNEPALIQAAFQRRWQKI